jgi:hypothetical protein
MVIGTTASSSHGCSYGSGALGDSRNSLDGSLRLEIRGWDNVPAALLGHWGAPR